jgi:hypothetical protein
MTPAARAADHILVGFGFLALSLAQRHLLHWLGGRIDRTRFFAFGYPIVSLFPANPDNENIF